MNALELAKKHGARITKKELFKGYAEITTRVSMTPDQLRAIIKEASAPLVEKLKFYADFGHREHEYRSGYVISKGNELGTGWTEIEHHNGGSTFIEEGSMAKTALAEFNKEFGDD